KKARLSYGSHRDGAPGFEGQSPELQATFGHHCGSDVILVAGGHTTAGDDQIVVVGSLPQYGADRGFAITDDAVVGHRLTEIAQGGNAPDWVAAVNQAWRQDSSGGPQFVASGEHPHAYRPPPP